MGSSSSSKTTREYNTTNVSQQAEGANIYGHGNRVNVSRADAVTLDNIARMQGESVQQQLELSGEMVGQVVSESESARQDALMFAGESLVEMREAQEAGYSFAGEATNRAFVEMREAQEAGYSFAGEATNRAFDSLDTSREDTFTFLGEAFTAAMENTSDNSDRLQEMARQTAGNLMQNTEYAMDQVADANESDNLEYMKLMLYAGVGLIGFIAWTRKAS